MLIESGDWGASVSDKPDRLSISATIFEEVLEKSTFFKRRKFIQYLVLIKVVTYIVITQYWLRYFYESYLIYFVLQEALYFAFVKWALCYDTNLALLNGLLVSFFFVFLKLQNWYVALTIIIFLNVI